jgi:hypothetical protein
MTGSGRNGTGHSHGRRKGRWKRMNLKEMSLKEQFHAELSEASACRYAIISIGYWPDTVRVEFLVETESRARSWAISLNKGRPRHSQRKYYARKIPLRSDGVPWGITDIPLQRVSKR